MIQIDNVIKNYYQPLSNSKFTLDQNDFSEISSNQTCVTKKHLVKLKSGDSKAQTQKQNNSRDSVQNYLQTIGQFPLLSAAEEVKLSRQVSDLLQLEQIRQQLAEKLERHPSKREWAQEATMIPRELSRRLDLGNQAKNKMIHANLRLVVFIAKKYLKRGLSLQDLIQEGNFGLIRAVEKFNPEKGCKFSTYAYWWIRQAIMQAIADQSRTIRLPIHIHDKLSRIKKTFRLLSQKLQRQPNETEMAESLDMSVKQLRFVLEAARIPFSLELSVTREGNRSIEDCIESDLPTPEQWIVKRLMNQEIETILNCLDSQERDILRLRYGLDDGAIKTPAEVARMFNLSREEINQIKGRAMNKLRRQYGNSDSKEYLA